MRQFCRRLYSVLGVLLLFEYLLQVFLIAAFVFTVGAAFGSGPHRLTQAVDAAGP